MSKPLTLAASSGKYFHPIDMPEAITSKSLKVTYKPLPEMLTCIQFSAPQQLRSSSSEGTVTCQSPYEQYGSSCFYQNWTVASWEQHNNACCKASGAELISITTVKEMSSLMPFLTCLLHNNVNDQQKVTYFTSSRYFFFSFFFFYCDFDRLWLGRIASHTLL